MAVDLDSIFSDPSVVRSLNEEFEIATPKRISSSQQKDKDTRKYGASVNDREQHYIQDKSLSGNSSHLTSDDIHSKSKTFKNSLSFEGICMIILLLAIILLLRASYDYQTSTPPQILTHTVTDYSVVTIEHTSTEHQPISTSTITSTYWNEAETSTATEVEYITSSFTETLTSTITSTETFTETSTKTLATTIWEPVSSIPELDAMNPEPKRYSGDTNLALNARVLNNYTTISDISKKILNPVNTSDCWIIGEDAVIGIELGNTFLIKRIVVHSESPALSNVRMLLYDLRFSEIKGAVGHDIDLNMPLNSFMLRLKGTPSTFCVKSIEIWC